jgi:putative polyhydroxyalkanoate system protein
MANLHIEREHALGLGAARQIAMAWAEQVEQEFSMECTYEEGDTADEVTFTRSGVNGKLHVESRRFVLDAKLGFLLGAFKDRIEAEIVKNLDALLSKQAGNAKSKKK